MNSEEVNALLTAIDNLLEIKQLIRTIVPTYDLNPSQNQLFSNLLESLQKKLNPLFLKYIKTPLEATSSTKELKKQLLGLEHKNIALVSSNSLKKKLKEIGMDPRLLIVSGGPLFSEDYIRINPNLPDKALGGIKQKCEHLINQLKTTEPEKDLIFIFNPANQTDKIILERLKDLSDLIDRNIKTFEIKSWKELG